VAHLPAGHAAESFAWRILAGRQVAWLNDPVDGESGVRWFAGQTGPPAHRSQGNGPDYTSASATNEGRSAG
jgi:hypothetical protein